MNKKLHQAFQGDVGIVELAAPDKEVNWKKVTSGFVVAEGEISGHHHKLIADRETTQLEIAKDEKGYFLRVTGGEAQLIHDTHETQTITPGRTYFLPLQEEYNEIEARRVLD